MGPPYTSPLARARVAPRVRSCDRRLQMLWLVPAGAHGTALGARTAWDLTSSHLPRASCRRGCQGAARTERLLAHHGAARLCFSSPHPAPVAVVAHSQHGAWRAWSCARVYGTAGEQDLHSLLPSATTGPSSIHRSTPLDHPPPETCACFFHVCRAWCAILLLLVHRAATLVFVVPAVSTKVGGFGHAWWRSKTSRKKLLLLPRPNPSPVLPLTRDQLSTL